MFRYVVAIVLSALSMSSLAYSQALDRTHVNYTNPLIYGSTCTAATLASTITAVGSTKQTLFITRTDRAKANCTWVLTANVTFNANTVVYIPAGVILSPNSGITVTFNGPVLIDDGDSLQGSGSFVFNWQEEKITSYITGACLPAVPSASLTFGTFPCQGVITFGGKNFNINQATSTIGPLAGDGNYWLILDFSKTRAIAGWTRQSGTSYLYKLSSAIPTAVPGTTLLAKVVVSGAVITTVTDYRIPASYVFSGRFDITDALYGAVAGTTDSYQAIQNAINRARGQEVYAPEGSYYVGSQLTDIRFGINIEVGTAHTQGLHLIGAGSMLTSFVSGVANAAMLKIEAAQLGDFEVRGLIKGFSIVSTSPPAGSIGIQLRSNWQLDLDDIRVTGMASDGIRIEFANADADGPVMVSIKRSWIAQNGGVGLNVVTPPGVGSVENSFLEIDRSFFFTNVGGGINVRALIFSMTNSASSLNGGFGGLRFHFPGAGSGTSRLAYVRGNEFGHNNGYGIEINGLSTGTFLNNECVNNPDSLSGLGYTSLGCIRFGNVADTSVTDIDVSHHHVRVFAVNTPFTAYNIRAEAFRVNIHDTRWSLFDAAGQDRYYDAGLQTRICDANVSGYIYCYPQGQNTNTATLNTGTPAYQPDANVYAVHKITLSDAVGYTITNPAVNAQHEGQLLFLDIFNNSGGIVSVSFGGTFMVGGLIVRTPIGEHSNLTFMRNGAGWSLISQQNSGYYESEGTFTPGIIAANTCYIAHITLPGAAVNDKITHGIDASIMSVHSYLTSSAFIYIPGAAEVRICNVSVGASSALPAGLIKVRAFK